MLKLLIVDDEPLVQVGVKSMINWGSYGIEVLSCASNGKQALDIIKKDTPDIVVTDIKMPTMDGLELTKYCVENLKNPPEFIILTSYGEFELAKKAIKYNVVDYLIKLELNADMLEESIKKAIAMIKNRKEETDEGHEEYEEVLISQSFEDKFFIRLLYNLFESEDQFLMQQADLNLQIEGYDFLTCFCEICSDGDADFSNDDVLNKYMCTLNMFKEISSKYLKCFVLSLDYKHFAVICCIEKDKENSSEEAVALCLKKVSTVIFNYYKVKIKIGVGNAYKSIRSVNRSFEEARRCYNYGNSRSNIVFYSDIKKLNNLDDTVDLSGYKEDFIRAFEEYDINALSAILSSIIDYLSEHSDNFIQALDCACNILYICMNLIDNGESYIKDIFSDDIDGYKSIYKKKNVEQIVSWITFLKDRLCEYMDERRNNYTNNTISHVKKYINEHINEKLSLNEISSIYNLSPSYLSKLFKKYCNIGFSEYITSIKISKAKELFTKDNYKVYEVSDMLGFESAFYFSKVFKKVTGYSPKEYANK